MDTATLEARMKAAETRFNDLATQKGALELEMAELRGEYQTLKSLMDNKVADTITANEESEQINGR